MASRPGKTFNAIRRLRLRQQNWGVYALSLFVALVFWVFNDLGNTFQTRIRYPILIKYDTQRQVLTGKLPESFQVSVTGTGWQIARCMWEDHEPIEIKINPLAELPIINLQRYLFSLKEELSELNVNGLTDEAIEVPLELKSSKTIQFALADSSILEGLDANSQLSFLPATVMVSGPASVIDTMSEVMQLQPAVDRLTEGYTEKFNLPSLKKMHCELSSRYVILSLDAVKTDPEVQPTAP